MKLEKTPQNHRRVGIIGLAVVALLGALILATSVFPFGKKTYTAILEHTAGVRVGEEVQVAGVGVGEVRSIELDGKQVRVDFTVDSGIDLGDRTTVEVKVATLLGTHFLLVKPQGEGSLSDDTVPISQTRVPFNLQDVINETGDLSAKLDVDVITDALAEVSKTFDATREEFLPAMRGISDLSKMFAKRSDDLGALLESTATFSEQLSGNTDNITVLMQQSNILMKSLLAKKGDIHRLLVDLRAIGEELSGLMEENREDVGPMLDNLNNTIDLLERNHETLGQTADLLGPTARYFANATGAGSWLDQHMPGALPDGLGCKLERRC